MKTTTIGRIGAIVTGAAMLGTAVAGALAGAQTVDPNLDKGFFYDSGMNPIVQVVVGEKAQSIDGASAGQIAAVIGNLAYKSTQESATQTVEFAGGTVTCPGLEGECEAGSASAEGAVTLSWEASGLVGDLEQKQMDCDIYARAAMQMYDLDDGGDSGSWCDSGAGYHEDYFPESTVATTLVSVCDVTGGDPVSILLEDEFPNEICTICYDYCDIALGCEPHVFVEWVNISCQEIELEFNCEEQELVMTAEDKAIIYNIFTDDILTGDILDENGALIGQSYLGRIILGQEIYYVEALDDDEITIVLGGTGSATTSAPMEYETPEGDIYSIKLVGAQTIEDTGVVDVTLEVTKPDGTTEQVTSGVSGIPVVGDIKVKLQRGTAASNVITGEQSFSAELLVWFIPSEYTFEDGERYTEEGVEDDDGIWQVEFNGGDTITVGDIEALEDDEELTDGLALPDEIDENDHWDNCYEDVDEDDNDTEVVRYISFELDKGDETELLPGEMIQLPFNDGVYLLSDLKFGYQGLMDENFLALDMQDTTTIDIERSGVDVWNVSSEDMVELNRRVEVDYVDKYGDSLRDVRIDNGPFESGDIFLIGDMPIEITDVSYNDAEDGAVIEYEKKDGSSWTEMRDDDNCTVDTDLAWPVANATIHSALRGAIFNYDAAGWYDDCEGVRWWVVNLSDEDDEDDWQIWIDPNDDNVFELADTDDSSGVQNVQTEFKNDVWFSGSGSNITIAGSDQTGAEDEIEIKINSSTFVGIQDSSGAACALTDNDCEDIAEGKENGDLVSLSGARIVVDSCEVEEPEDSGSDEDMVCQVTVTIPENEVRPTLFFGTSTVLNTTSVTITDSDQGAEVTIGGVPVIVESFGVTGTVAPGGTASTNQTTVSYPGDTKTVNVPYETIAVNSIGYSLVVVEGAQSQQNLVLIGGPAVNSLTQDLVTAEDLQNGAQVTLSGNKLLVAGYEGPDTSAAATALVNWLKANV